MSTRCPAVGMTMKRDACIRPRAGSLCSSYDSSQLEDTELGPVRLLRLSGSLAFDGPWADRDAAVEGTSPDHRRAYMA